MVFSSSLFLLYVLPAFFLIFHLLDRRYRNGFVLLTSIGFYAWGAPGFVAVVLGCILTDFYGVRLLARLRGGARRGVLAVLVGSALALLLYFKYANFFVDNLNGLLAGRGTPLAWERVVLPIGISFLTFQRISYAVDVYRGVHEPMRRLPDYALYILLFPHAIAGPIVKFNEIADQIENPDRPIPLGEQLGGFIRFVVGLAKKVLIANVIGEYADAIFGLPPAQVSGATAWLGVLAYTFQIYFDFSGYSDMAIGIGRMIGFRFPENFDAPYIARSTTDFWKRWHMTLGRWMRDYLYIPLGGNRVGSAGRLYANLATVFLLSGFWHGATWGFLAWGAYQGLFLVIDRLGLTRLTARWPGSLQLALTFLITMVGWVIFRANTLAQAGELIGRLAQPGATGTSPLPTTEQVVTLLLAAALSFAPATAWGAQVQRQLFAPVPLVVRPRALATLSVGTALLLLVCLSYVTASTFNPFIYFRF